MKAYLTKSTESNYRSILDERINTSYALRKRNLQHKNYQERVDLIAQMNKIDSVLEIRLNELSIQHDVQKSFESSTQEGKLILACNYLASDNIDVNKYGIYSIRKIIEGNYKTIDQVIPIEVINSICSCILLQENLSIYYEACTSLIHLTKCSSYFSKLLAEEKYLKVIIQLFLKENDIRIRSQLLLLLGNMLEELETAFLLQIQHHFNLCQIVLDYILNDNANENDSSIPMVSKWIMLWFIGIMIKYIPKQNIPELLYKSMPVFRVIITYLISNLNKKLFTEALSCIRNLFHQASECESLTLLLDNIDIHPLLSKYVDYSLSSNNLIDLFDILLTLTYSSNEAVDCLLRTDFFMNTGVFLNEFMMKRCSSKRMPMITLLNVLKNCTSCSNGRNHIVRKTSVTYYLCELIKVEKDKEIVKGILRVLLECLEDNRSDIKCEMVRIEVPEVFITKLNGETEAEMIELCLKGIDLFLAFGISIVKGKNILKELFEMLNVIEVLERLINHQDQSVSDYSNQLLMRYFEKKLN